MLECEEIIVSSFYINLFYESFHVVKLLNSVHQLHKNICLKSYKDQTIPTLIILAAEKPPPLKLTSCLRNHMLIAKQKAHLERSLAFSS